MLLVELATASRVVPISMADKKEDCECGCMGLKKDSGKVKKEQKKPKKSE